VAAEGADGADPGVSTPAVARGTLPLHVEVKPSCARRGSSLAVRITTVANAALGLAIGYSDNQPHGAMQISDADGAGSFVWKVLVAPDSPEGRASVLVSSSNGKESAAQQIVFAVAGAKGC
jgi:hypothetical protein